MTVACRRIASSVALSPRSRMMFLVWLFILRSSLFERWRAANFVTAKISITQHKHAYVPSKPQIPTVFKRHLFLPVEAQPQENCMAVYEALLTHGDTQAAITVYNIIEKLQNSGQSSDGNTEWDGLTEKECRVNMGLLNDSLGPHNDLSKTDNLALRDRLVKCYVDDKNRRGILQSIIVSGLCSDCLNQSFVSSLYNGNDGSFDPSLQLDAEGNTLMHLAAMAPTDNCVKAVIQLETNKNSGDQSRRMNTIFWILSLLEMTNKAGDIPVKLAKQDSAKEEIRQIYRTYSYFLKMQARRHGLAQRMI